MHIVKCTVCGQKFDRDKIPFELDGEKKRRYKHKVCPRIETSEIGTTVATLEKSEYRLLTDAIDRIFKKKVNWKLVAKQIRDYKKNYGYTEKSIRLTLEWYYDIKKNSVYEGNGGIGIVPFVLQEAKNYYEKKAKAQNQKKEQIIADKVKIAPPMKKKIVRLFDFEEV